MAARDTDAVRARTEAARRHAEELAAGFRRLAEAPDAAEVDRIRAETAAVMVENAATRAALIDRAEAAAMVAEAARAALALERSTAEEVMRLVREGHDLRSGPVKEAVDRAVAATEALEAGVVARMADHELAVWLEAVDKLTLLERPPGDVVAGPVVGTEH